MIYLPIIGLLYIPSFINVIYMGKKEIKLHLEFDKKLKDKGYEKTDDYNLVSLIADEVVDRREYATRILLSLFPVSNLYPFIQIITKKLDCEYKTILDSLDNQEVLESLEEKKYIFNQNTIFRVKENIISKMDEMIKIDGSSIDDNKHIEISENDSLKQLKQKKKLLNEMIYLQKLKKMEQNFLHQESETDKDLTGKGKQLGLIKKNNKKSKI